MSLLRYGGGTVYMDVSIATIIHQVSHSIFFINGCRINSTRDVYALCALNASEDRRNQYLEATLDFDGI